MRSLIAIAALVASVSANAGSLDGKAIICDRGEESDSLASKFGFAFNESEVFQYDISLRHLNPEVKIIVFSPHEYAEYLDSVRWGHPYGTQSWELDRKTLALTEKLRDESLEFACKALPSWEALNEIMESVRADEQSKNDEQLKDNKI